MFGYIKMFGHNNQKNGRLIQDLWFERPFIASLSSFFTTELLLFFHHLTLKPSRKIAPFPSVTMPPYPFASDSASCQIFLSSIYLSAVPSLRFLLNSYDRLQFEQMDDNQLSTHLHYGAVVHISCFRDKTNFYLYSNGISFKNVIALSASDGPTEASMALFKIMPIIKFQSQQFLEKLLKERYESEEGVRDSEEQIKNFIDQFEFQLTENNNLVKQQNKYLIKYNEDFMLQHIYSSKYLTYLKNEKTNEYILELLEIPTKFSIFNLESCFNYQKDINVYIPFNSAAFLNIKIYEGLQIKDYYLNFKKESIFDTWTTSEEEKQQISIGLYQTAEELQHKDICYGDTVWIFHLESGSFVKLVEPNDVESFILKKINFALGRLKDDQEMKEDRAGVDAITSEIFLQKTENETSAEKFGLWKIIYAREKEHNVVNRKQHYDRFKGGKVRFDQEVRFYNIRHQVYLSVRKVKVGRNKFKCVLATEKNQQDNTNFRIKSLSPNSIYATTEDLFLIQHVLTETYLTLGEQFKINDTKGILLPQGEFKKEDNFKFTKVEFIQEWQNNNIMSILPFLREGIRVFEENALMINAREEVILQLLVENLIQLLSFSYDLTEGFEASSNKLGKMTYNHFQVQRLLKQQGIIALLIHLLTRIDPRVIERTSDTEKEIFKIKGSIKIVKGFNAQLLNDRKSIEIDPGLVRKIVNLCLKILRNCCKSNNENSLILFQQMGVFAKFLSLQTYAQQFFMDSFSKPAILFRMTTRDFLFLFSQYVQIFNKRKQFSADFFKLMVRFLEFQGESVGNNQLEAFKLTFQQPNPLIIPIQNYDGQLYINYYGKRYELKEFTVTYPRDAGVLASQIHYFAYMTFDRNYVCSKKIKEIFPLSILIDYITCDLYSQIKAALINVFTHCYLNERPRFLRKVQKVFPLFGVKTKQDFKNSLLSRQRIKERENVKQIYEYQLKQMYATGLSTEGIDQILSCVEQKNFVGEAALRRISKWMVGFIQKTIEQNDDRFYSYDVESCMDCLRFMIELGVFSAEQSGEITELVRSIVKRISKSLQLQNEVKIELKSDNFKELLLEMVEKNVIKQFNYSAKYDGVEDQTIPENICSQYVNYAFYQNILLLEKNSHLKRKQSVRVIVAVLKLISLFNSIFVEQKIEQFLGEVIENETELQRSGGKQKAIQKLMTSKILKEPMKGREDIVRLLLLLFYNNNTYYINYQSIRLIASEINSESNFIQELQTIIFITEKEEQQKLFKMIKNYREIRLLTETSQVWLNSNFQLPTYHYNSVILYFIDKIRSNLKVLVPGFREERWTPFDSLSGLEHAINLQRQIILSNMDAEEEVMKMIKSYRHYLVIIKSTTRTNHLFIRLFKYCLLFLFAFIYNCPQNKQKMSQHIEDVSVSEYFLKLCPIQIGQSRFLIEYLKDNYEECLDFYMKYNETLKKFNKYTENYSKLFLVLLNYYGEPIQANLKKFFINIFDYNSFKEFLWLKEGREFQLNTNLLLEVDLEPYFYHINALDALLYLYDNLGESVNTIRNHIKKTLSQEYLFSLLAADDYFTKQNSIKPLLKVQVLFKARIFKLIARIYVHESNPLILKELQKYNRILNMFINEAASRQETDDFRKIIILKDIKQDENTAVDYRINELYTVTFGEKFLLQTYLEGILKFAESVKRSENCENYHGIAETVVQQALEIYQILHTSSKIKKQRIQYPIPNQLNFKLASSRKGPEMERKKGLMSIILEAIYMKHIYKTVEDNQVSSIKRLKKILEDINLKQFLFFRKISQFLEDAFEKLPQDTGQVNTTLSRLMQILTLFIDCEENQKANEVRNLMGKSQLVYPILNYFQTSIMNVPNRKLFLVCLQYLNSLLGDDGNRLIQTIFNKYFTNKSDPVDFFQKIKQILNEINFQQAALYKCRRLYDGIDSYYNNVSNQKLPEFILLQFFINLCKGNFQPNQIYLGSLSTKSSFNITRGIWEILKNQSQKYKNHLVNVQNYYRITQCLSTIRQFVEGPCLQNQNQFLKRDFFLTVLSYLQYEMKQHNLELQQSLEEELAEIAIVSPYVSKELRIYLNQDKITREWMPSQVKYRCISLISSLMSENVNQKSISQLLTIPHELLIKELDRVYERYQELKLEYKRTNLQFGQQQEVVLPLGFKIYEVLQYYPKQKLPQSSPGLDFFKQNSRIVEVMHKNLAIENLTIVVFPKIQTEISDAFKQKFLENADRTSVNSKLRDLQKAQIQNRQSDFPYGYIIFFLTLLLILFDLIIYVPETLPYVQDFTFYSIFLSYGSFQILQPTRAATLFVIVVLSGFFLYLQIKGAVYMRETIEGIVDSDSKRLEKFKVIMKLFIENLDYLHYFFTMILAILGIFNPLFDSLVLVLQLFRRSETFFIILKAIKETMDQLCVVLLINLILTYILASILYFYYGSGDYAANCQTLYYCFIFALSIGFKADAGFVGLYDSTKLSQNFATVTFWDVLVNFSYLFIIKVIMDQVIGAIIVDKFAQIRQEKQSLQQDENSRCFICGIERNILDRQQDGFQKHKEQYHVIWNYMQFLIHIKESKLGNLTGIERYVYDQFKGEKLNWFPISRSFHLESKKSLQGKQIINREAEIQSLTKSLDAQVHDINQHLSQMQDIINIKILKEKKKEEK